jgi:hypothetical protein
MASRRGVPPGPLNHPHWMAACGKDRHRWAPTMSDQKMSVSIENPFAWGLVVAALKGPREKQPQWVAACTTHGGTIHTAQQAMKEAIMQWFQGLLNQPQWLAAYTGSHQSKLLVVLSWGHINPQPTQQPPPLHRSIPWCH